MFDPNPVKTPARQTSTDQVEPGLQFSDDDEGGAGRLRRKSNRSTEVTQVKQFLVMKWVEGLNQMAGMIALPGLFTLEAAQQLVKQATDNEPEAMYMIQEVGAA